MKEFLTYFFTLTICVIGLVFYRFQSDFKIHTWQYWILEIPVLVLVIYPLGAYWKNFIKKAFNSK